MSKIYKSKIVRKESGMAYVTLLVLLAVLSSLGLTFLHKAGTLTAASATRLSGIQADYLAEAAVNHAMWRLLNETGFPASESVYYMHSLAGGRYGYKVRRHTNTTFATIATVGAVGQSEVHQSYVQHIKPFPAQQMVTGTYLGDGLTGRFISGVGFQPDMVIIKGNIKRRAVIRTSTMTGENAKLLVDAVELVDNLILSLDADGFRIGSGDEVNKVNYYYYWAAFRAVPGEMKVGKYTGDGASDRVISGLGGFQPELIIVLSEGAHEPIHRSNQSTLSFNFSTEPGISNCLTTPVPFDGFRVGSDNRVNKVGVTYHYVCWPNIAGQQKFSGYSGDGIDGRKITGLGFRPEYVMVRAVSESHSMIHRSDSIGVVSDQTMYFGGKLNTTDRIQALQEDGYQVGSTLEVNNVGISYEYLAWVRK